MADERAAEQADGGTAETAVSQPHDNGIRYSSTVTELGRYVEHRRAELHAQTPLLGLWPGLCLAKDKAELSRVTENHDFEMKVGGKRFRCKPGPSHCAVGERSGGSTSGSLRTW